MPVNTPSPSNRGRLRGVVRAEAGYRLACLRTVARWNDSLLVTEFPKSGGTWLSELVSDLTGTDFPQNRFPKFGKTLYHGHHVRRFPGVRTIVLWRDPRDIVVSWYFHSLVSRHTHKGAVAETRSAIDLKDIGDVRENLPRFIEYMFTEQRAPGFTWNTFFDTWSARPDESLHTSYERLSADTATELSRLAKLLGVTPVDGVDEIVARHSFERKAGRRRGSPQNESFLRKGVVGDWKETFSPDALRVLEKHLGRRLEAYEAFVGGFPDFVSKGG